MVFTPGQSVFSGIGPICPTGTVELTQELRLQSCFVLGDPIALLCQPFLHIILIISGPLSSTFARASTRIRQAYAEGSRCSYYNKFNILLSFCIYYNLDFNNLSINNCIFFLEILATSGLSTTTIAIYISALRH